MRENISIVIPVRNQALFVGWCLNSVIENTNGCEIIIVDDDSDEQTKRVIDKYRSIYSEIVLSTNKEQRWLSYNWNIGAELSTRKYICFLNSDTIVSDKWYEYLLKPFIEFDGVGITGPTTSSCWGKQRHNKYHSNRFNYKTTQSVNQIAQEIFNEYASDPYEFMDVVGFCFFSDSKIFKSDKILFDEDFKGPGNEADWMVRVKKNGYRSVWCRQSYVHHFGRMSFDGDLGYKKAWELWHEGDDLLLKKYGKKISLEQG